jgi:hypothetical protein
VDRTPAGELILTEATLATCWPNFCREKHTRGFCPYHQGSTGHDLMIDPVYGRFSCIVCGKTGWTEDGWNRWLAQQTYRGRR